MRRLISVVLGLLFLFGVCVGGHFLYKEIMSDVKAEVSTLIENR